MTELDPLSDRIVQLHRALVEADVPYAFGGAIVLFFFSEPRATVDIDLNIFLPADHADHVMATLGELDKAFQDPAALEAIRASGQTRVKWHPILVDLFFANLPFLLAAAERARTVPFAGEHISVLSPEDLVVCKAMFDRGKDWVDIEQLLYIRAGSFDAGYTRSWLVAMLGEDDPRVTRFDELMRAAEDWARENPGP